MRAQSGLLMRWVGALILALSCGCTHWVVIRSRPPGATARIDGVNMGQTPLFFEETTGWSKVYRLELEKEGYEPLAAKLSQDELQWRYACPSVCLCPPTLGLSLTGCLFSYGLPEELRFDLVPLYGTNPGAADKGGQGESPPGNRSPDAEDPATRDADREKKRDEENPPPEAIPF